MGKKLKVLVSLFLFCLLSQGVWALVFTARDGVFTIDLPSTWSKVEPTNDYLFLKNTSGATMRFVQIDNCFDRDCLEKIVDKEIKDLAKRKFQIIKNEYTEESIKETEFSTGDPLFSFDFTKQDMLFTAGYFLSAGKAYNVGIRGVPDTEASYLLSFISPAPKEQVLQEEHNAVLDQVAQIAAVEQSDLLTPIKENQTEEKPKIQAKTRGNLQIKSSQKTLQIIILILLAYLFVWLSAFLFKSFFSSKLPQLNTNPNSPYPLRAKRLYGSPDLFLRVHDNLGNHYIVTSTRWGGIFVIIGLGIAVISTLIRLVLSLLILKASHPSLIMNTLHSLSYLFTACGVIVFMAGMIINLLFPYKFLFYDNQGNILFKCVQKGFSLFYEQYFLADGQGKVLCKFTRKNFSLLRNWRIFDSQKELAQIKEQNVFKSLLRRLMGHLFGFLRTNYIIKGQLDSTGYIQSAASPSMKSILFIDKPQAVPAELMLAFFGVLFLRDRDKSFPWIN